MNQKNNSNSKKVSLALCITGIIFAVIAGVLGGFFAGYHSRAVTALSANQSIREHTDKYTFIRPLLAVNRTNISIPSPAYAALSQNVQNFIAGQKKSGDLTTASVYFIDYGDNSGSFALNEKEPYAPASLLKVVVMIAYLKRADSDPSILQQELVYHPSVAQSLQSVPFESPSDLIVGKAYPISSLINAMIADSDNGAMNLLVDSLESEYLNTVYEDIGLEGPEDSAPYTISANDYSLLLRVLFNGTYLSSENSEKALSILSKATFKDGLVAGVPAGTVVAHKFGEHIETAGEKIGSIELHDCGFVYPKQGPYLLCVMTRGQNLETLKATISGISKIVYSEISRS